MPDPTGLTLGAELAAHGILPWLVDRAHRPDPRIPRPGHPAADPRVTGQARDHAAAGRRGNQAVQLRLHTRGRETAVALLVFGLAETAYPFLLFLSQADTERILADHLTTAGIAVEREFGDAE